MNRLYYISLMLSFKKVKSYGIGTCYYGDIWIYKPYRDNKQLKLFDNPCIWEV